MSQPIRLFVIAWLVSQGASLVLLAVGTRLTGQPLFLRIGQMSHDRKMQAMDRMWPLTKVRPAVESRNLGMLTTILAAAIAVKSLASLVFGVIMVFWLPLASLLVPSIVAVHDPDDPSLVPWVRKVAALQVTSHAVAAAAGFVVVVLGPLASESLAAAFSRSAGLVAVACVISLVFAVAAGRAEALGLMERGI